MTSVISHRFGGSAALSSSCKELLTRAAVSEDLARAGEGASKLMTGAMGLKIYSQLEDLFFHMIILFFLDFSLATVHKNIRFKLLNQSQYFHHIFTDKHTLLD